MGPLRVTYATPSTRAQSERVERGHRYGEIDPRLRWGHGEVQPPSLRYVTPPVTASRAVAAVGLGLASFVLGAIAGVPAIIVGALARKDIDRSSGRLVGSSMAAFGIVSGLFGTGLSLVLGLSVLGAALGDGAPADSDDEHTAIVAQARIGDVDVVDLDRTKPLQGQLAEVAKAERAKGRVVVLQTCVRTSRGCAEVEAALPDRRMQHALANVTLVRVDVEVFRRELAAMHVDVQSVPWFYKLDAAGRATDAISAGEWDDNVPENMAPVLERFVRGTLAPGRRAINLAR